MAVRLVARAVSFEAVDFQAQGSCRPMRILTESGVVSGVFKIPLDVSQDASDRHQDRGTQRRLPLREFIGGLENALAWVAARSIQRGPGKELRYNPLFFYGCKGTGKTELTRTLVANWQRHHPAATIVGTVSAGFLRQCNAAVKHSRSPDWLFPNHDYCMLILDDIHQLTQKRSVQILLAQIVDHFVRNGCPVLATGEAYPPGDVALGHYLASRLSSGLTVHVRPPGYQARCEILRQLAGERFTDSAIRYAASHMDGTVPQLHAMLRDLLGHNTAYASPMDEASFRRLLSRNGPRNHSFSVDSIIRAVARQYQLPLSQLVGPSRRQSLTQARAVAIYMIRKLVGCSFSQIGKAFHHRDHSTVLHAYRKAEWLAQHDAPTRQTINRLMASQMTSHDGRQQKK